VEVQMVFNSLCPLLFLLEVSQALISVGASICALSCRLQACRLANPSHVEVQMVFKGQMPQGHQQWDNNDGNNWQVRHNNNCSV
jgi:hypothetical protein